MMITIHKINETFIKLSSDDIDDMDVLAELDKSLTFVVDGYKFMPAYKMGFWDGKIRLFDMKTGKVYFGLLNRVTEFLNERNITFKKDLSIKNNHVTREEIEKFIDDLDVGVNGTKLDVREYQKDTIEKCINQERLLFTVPTSGGKSFIAYVNTMWHLCQDRKVLCVVPTVDLVNQLFDDFKDYSKQNGYDVEKNMHKISAGASKIVDDYEIVVTTWQSIYKESAQWLNQFDVIIGDEAHLFNAKSLTSILEKATKIKYRIGMTGTLADAKVNKLVLEGLFGGIYNATTTKKLMDDGHISNLKIYGMVLNHDDDTKKLLKKASYDDEIKFLNQNKKRNRFIVNLASSLSGTTLVLFNLVEKHGRGLYDDFVKHNPDKDAYFLSGDSDKDERAQVKIDAKKKDIVIFASYKLYSTGISIPTIKNIIFCQGTKSKIRVSQSIGRGLRLHESKTHAKLFDIADDLSNKNYVNHSMRHFKERLELYNREGFDYTIKIFDLF